MKGVIMSMGLLIFCSFGLPELLVQRTEDHHKARPASARRARSSEMPHTEAACPSHSPRCLRKADGPLGWEVWIIVDRVAELIGTEQQHPFMMPLTFQDSSGFRDHFEQALIKHVQAHPSWKPHAQK